MGGVGLPSRLVPKLCSFVATVVLLAGCTGGSDAPATIDGAAVTVAPHPDGGFLWASIDGTVADDSGATVATVDVDTDGQRGLLGLAVDDDGRVFVSYTDVTFDLIVSELVDDGTTRDERIIWRGPTTVQGGNGGRLVALDGELIVGIGLLNDRDGQADPNSIVGKLVALDPDATPDDQAPRILSGPWNNPFAFDATPAGEVWVADNHPRDGEERLARGDLGIDPEVALVLPEDSAPSGLAAGADALFICSYNSLTLVRYDLVDGVPVAGEELADDCVFDVTLLADGDLAYSTGTTIVRIAP